MMADSLSKGTQVVKSIAIAAQQLTTVLVVPDEDVLRQADADAGEREADAEPHAAAGADVPNHLGAEPGAPTDSATEAEPHAPERAGRRVDGIPPLVPPKNH